MTGAWNTWPAAPKPISPTLITLFITISYVLHAVRHLNTQQLHAVGDDAGCSGREMQPETTDCFIFRFEDGLLVIEFIVLFSHLIAVVGHVRRTEFPCRRLDGSRIIAKQLNQIALAR